MANRNKKRRFFDLCVEIVFPRTHLEKYLDRCSDIEFERRLTPRMQRQERLFAPYHYKDPFVRDCVIELKERDNQDVARMFGRKIAQWITKCAVEIRESNPDASLFVVPVPQHRSKTADKGFSHTHTLSENIVRHIPADLGIQVLACVEKRSGTKRLHDLKGKSSRFKTIKGTMRAHVTKESASRSYFFVVDDVYTTGATFKEARRSLTDCAAPPEHIYFAAIAH